MQPIHINNDALVEIATFLARRWSFNNSIHVEFANINNPKTHLQNNTITLPSITKYSGNDFNKYRQFRTTLWYESMRLKFCEKIFSDDHVFGFILNTIETRRIEMLGRKIWRGMDQELIINYNYLWTSRPQLSSIYGRTRIIEAFYQYFLLSDFKGEIQSNYIDKIKNATKLAKNALDECLKNDHSTTWLEKKIPEIIKLLQVDPFLTITIPRIIKNTEPPLDEKELLKMLKKISNDKKYLNAVNVKNAISEEKVKGEFSTIIDQQYKNKTKGGTSNIQGISIPEYSGVNEMYIYDNDLIRSLKNKFRTWKTRWYEQMSNNGDEFDADSYIEYAIPFFKDFKNSIKTKIMILLDHSSSIASNEIQYKKTSIAFCEVLSDLKIKFSIYAFNTQDKMVRCWAIKDENTKWNNICAKRLAVIKANGGTPLSDVYSKMHKIVQIKKPDVLLTLTDGEPSDPNGVRHMTHMFKMLKVNMVSIGIGPDMMRAIEIANNLKQLGYERSLAVYNIDDIPKKVLKILEKLS